MIINITQLMQIGQLHIHHHTPKMLIGLRSANCGGHLNAVNSLSSSRNKTEVI